MLVQLLSALASLVGTAAVVAVVCFIRVREARHRRDQAAKRAETERLAKLRNDLTPDDRQWLIAHGADWLKPEPKATGGPVRVVVHEGPDGTLTYSQADTSGRTTGDELDNAIRRLQRNTIGCSAEQAARLAPIIGPEKIRRSSDEDLHRLVADLDDETKWRLERDRLIRKVAADPTILTKIYR